MDEFLKAMAQFFRYILPIVGVIALAYLALFLKKAIESLKEFDKALTILASQIQKLDQPLETIENVSKTVDDANTKVREFAASTAQAVTDNSEKMKEWVKTMKEDGTLTKSTESVKNWFSDKKEWMKDGVETINEAWGDQVQSMREKKQEYPIYHGQEDES